ncbi:MAG: CRISPR-associated protein Cas5 [Firmicutes bacterium ADurb.Bin099]|nr:MAG: CRISPR-associated protein Cas5 [Firmicutes bacterium ADurb.Bin099]
MHENIVEFEVHGDYALFSDPITRTGGEKCTYLIPTYEAIKGVLHSVYWKPTIIWIIDSVRVMNQIQTVTKGMRPIKYSEGKNDLSFYTYLKDCRYQVKAHFIWNENRPELVNDRNENKHHNVAKRMIEKGGKRDIFLGCRECQAYVEPCVFGEGKGFYDNPSCSEVSFGLMYHGITYADEAYSQDTKNKMTVRFWHAVMKNGYIDYPKPSDCTIYRPISSMEVKPFGENLQNFTCLKESEEVSS